MKENPVDTEPIALTHPVRFITATSLFDGHDVSINIIRRILQSSGVEVIHLGHNRAAADIVRAAIQEDVHAIAITSYQGGHLEFFRYLHDLLREHNCGHIKIFGGGGGTILPDELDALHDYGIARLYSPDDGRRLGLQGMVNDMLRRCDESIIDRRAENDESLSAKNPVGLGRALSAIESGGRSAENTLDLFASDIADASSSSSVVGITGTGGAGKSSLIDELVLRFLDANAEKTAAIIAVDPSRRKSGGALLGDRLRLNVTHHSRVFMRSLATRRADHALPACTADILRAVKAAGFDLIIFETSGIGQADTGVVEHVDISVYVMTPEFGAPTQLEKIDMLDFADMIVLNKFDKRGADDALAAIRKQYKRNHNCFAKPDVTLPVFATRASCFADVGVARFYHALCDHIAENKGVKILVGGETQAGGDARAPLIPATRTHYLGDIVQRNREYQTWVGKQCTIARELFHLQGAMAILQQTAPDENLDDSAIRRLRAAHEKLAKSLAPENAEILAQWDEWRARYDEDVFCYTVRGREIKVAAQRETLSHVRVPKVALPTTSDWGDRLRWVLTENVPGEFPFAAGVFPFKRSEEEPTRMFAGEGSPERTNRRFHYVSRGMPAKRLSTAFDSVTLYGEDPASRPDIYGKIGNSGVSVATLDDAKKLYSGFALADATTSVSMTINGPAPIILGFFLNAAIDQECERYIHKAGLADVIEEKIAAIFAEKNLPRPQYHGELPDGHDGLGLLLLGVTGDEVLPPEVYAKVKADTHKAVRGTVQADILKEDQAQNTCIFATDFALWMMGEIQEYFIAHSIRNFYSVSVSGYHIAEAGANPITQLALTLANGFTFVEAYLARGMKIDDFAPSLSFFFSMGMDPEYAVIGRVARRIWAKVIKLNYGGNERSQKLKYHIQTSGRSLHAQEIAFNDIRTTLQALYAIHDNCNSLHTNAYDEAITTPTEESVRRALAIQLIINREFGLAFNENSLQGSFIIETLTDLVEEAVLQEFTRLNERGGVLGAMETMYQRSRIQEESMEYEMKKQSGELPLIGVNTFLSEAGSPTVIPGEVIRATEAEKKAQIDSLHAFHAHNAERSDAALTALRESIVNNENSFSTLMETCKVASLGQITEMLYHVGGQYRRSM